MKTTLLCCIVFALCANFFIITAKAQVHVNDSLALVDLYNSTNGPNWTVNSGWLSKSPVSTWYGVTVDSSRVTRLFLFDNNLNGTLPSSIGNLSQLTYLNLYTNASLTGSIPASIGKLTNLQFLHLGYDQLSGAIPSSIGNLASLQYLDLSYNQLSGPIPPSIGKLTNLQYLILNNNQLSGVIPSSTGNLLHLSFLILLNNRLSGAIPSSIGKMGSLFSLNLSNNQLSGTIPSSIGKLNAFSIDLSYNQLNGEIPFTFKDFNSFRNVYLSHNHLSESTNIYSKSYNQNLGLHGDISYNNENFNGMELVATKIWGVVYAPQANIPVHQNGNVLYVSAGGTAGNNTYYWFKVGATDSITIKKDSTFTPSQSGMYYVKVTNKIALLLTLYSDTIDFVLSTAKQSTNTLITKAIHPATIIQPMFVYPNPANNVIHLQTNGTAIITLTNADGKVLLIKSINNSYAVNVSSFAPGAYYLKNKTTGEVQKVVVVH